MSSVAEIENAEINQETIFSDFIENLCEIDVLNEFTSEPLIANVKTEPEELNELNENSTVEHFVVPIITKVKTPNEDVTREECCILKQTKSPGKNLVSQSTGKRKRQIENVPNTCTEDCSVENISTSIKKCSKSPSKDQIRESVEQLKKQIKKALNTKDGSKKSPTKSKTTCPRTHGPQRCRGVRVRGGRGASGIATLAVVKEVLTGGSTKRGGSSCRGGRAIKSGGSNNRGDCRLRVNRMQSGSQSLDDIQGSAPVADSLGAAPPQPSNSFTDSLRLIRKNKIIDRRNMARLNPAQMAQLQEMRMRKEVSHFLLPDAPPSKKKRPSPERIPCPLLPGVPATPPPPVKQPWQLARASTSAAPVPAPRAEQCQHSPPATSPPGPSRYSPSITPAPGPSRFSPEPPTTSNYLEYTPSKGVFPQMIDGEKLLGFSPEPSIFEELEDDVLEDDLLAGRRDGSDLEDDDVALEAEDRRTYEEFTEDLQPELLEVLGAMDRQDDASLRASASEDLLEFAWSGDSNVFTGQRENFLGPAGPTFNVSGLSPLQIFRQIWDDDIVNLIVMETNRYAADLLTSSDLPPRSRLRRWVPITSSELWSFFSILMLQSIISIAVEKDYWYPPKPYLKVGDFPSIMPFDRFKLIKRCLHFVDNKKLPSTPGRLHKIKPILDHLNLKFSSLYLPEQEVAIDESLLLWKGRLSFAQLIATKAAQVGIKSYELCESKTGYLWSFFIYADKTSITNSEVEGSPSKIVMQLLGPLLNKGYTVVMDNFYNSPLLSRTLKKQKTDSFGTLRLNREFVPESLKAKTKFNMRTGEVAVSHTNDLTVTVWRDSNVVSLISTFHDIGVGGKGKYGSYRYKPKVVLDYNLSMGGVDKKDQLLQAFPVERLRNQIWYKKLFRRLLNVSILNAYIIYKKQNPKITHRQFRTDLADEILKTFSNFMPNPPAPSTDAGHFPVRNDSKYKRCKQCSKRNPPVASRTAYKCKACLVDLCVLCFDEYHTKV